MSKTTEENEIKDATINGDDLTRLLGDATGAGEAFTYDDRYALVMIGSGMHLNDDLRKAACLLSDMVQNEMKKQFNTAVFKAETETQKNG